MDDELLYAERALHAGATGYITRASICRGPSMSLVLGKS